ncbi:SPOR domain-containing protein [Erythrobacter sp. THAF29]|uniref:SPOR domain-containing protein n=1 Tax=Erythrobacter sp. THAF29 TaxID=2587851 RepID=UPI001267F236|nr:SPOR domain-containing protein [Erythrobacter sp. THAF29]QFT76939.1 Sporulation related domain protein [Erythrobacter sp. THAF29]
MANRNEGRTASPAGTIRAATVAGIAAITLLAGPALADVKAGVDAWSSGDFARAVAEWKEPAASGDADAQFNLAQAYRLGRGVEADIARAKELYAEAAQNGHAKAADNYGLLLFQQGEQDKAMPLIRAAAERGDPRAQYILGLAHFNADYAEKDWVRAYALMTLSQAQGLPQAANALSEMDRYVPQKQRQIAQSLARDIESEATRRRSAELAALDLGSKSQAQMQLATAAPSTPAVAPTRVAAGSAPQPAAPTPAAPRVVSEWKVQLGAFGVAGNADRLWQKLSATPALSGTSKVLVPTGKVTKLQAKGFASKAEAQSACAQLKRQGQGCLVTKS